MVIIYKPALKKTFSPEREKKNRETFYHIIDSKREDKKSSFPLRPPTPGFQCNGVSIRSTVCDSYTLSTRGNNPDSGVSFEKRLVKKCRLSDFCLPVLLVVVNTAYLQKKKNPIKRFFFLLFQDQGIVNRH